MTPKPVRLPSPKPVAPHIHTVAINGPRVPGAPRPKGGAS